MQSHPRPLLHESQLCELPTSPSTVLSLLEAEVYRKTGLLLSCPVGTLGLRSVFVYP